MSHKFFDMFEIRLISFFMKKINAPLLIIKNLYHFFTRQILKLRSYLYSSIFTRTIWCYKITGWRLPIYRV